MPTKLFSELSSNICIMVVFWKLKLDARLVGWHFYCNTELVLCIWRVDEMPDNFDTREKMVSDGLSRLFYFIVCFSLVDYGVYYNIPQRKTFFANYTRMYIVHPTFNIRYMFYSSHRYFLEGFFMCNPKNWSEYRERAAQAACMHIFMKTVYYSLFSFVISLSGSFVRFTHNFTTPQRFFGYFFFSMLQAVALVWYTHTGFATLWNG